MEPISSLQYSQQPATWPNRKPDQTSPRSTPPLPQPSNPTPWRSILISSSHRHLGHVSGHLPWGSQIKPYVYVSFPPYMPYTPHVYSSRFEYFEGFETKFLCVTALHSAYTLYLCPLNVCQNTQIVFPCRTQRISTYRRVAECLLQGTSCILICNSDNSWPLGR